MKTPRYTDVPAWDVEIGAVLPDGHRVIDKQRDARARTVRVVTSEPTAAELPAEALIPILVRPPR